MFGKEIKIIGGGVAGLCIGWKLAASGYAVTLYDSGEVGRGASWAAAGMLAAAIEAEPGEDALLPFALEAQQRWPAFARELESYSGKSAGYAESGTLFIAAEADDLGILKQRHAYLSARGLPVNWCAPGELRKKEPFLAPRITSALFSAHDHQADNRLLVEALHAACRKAGVTIHARAPVEEILISGGRVSGLKVKGETLAAENIILCAGAWSATIKGLPAEIIPPVFPMKGQMVALQMEPRLPLLRHVLWTPQIYMVPRADGRLIIGATMEDKGFDSQMTAGGMLHLLREAWEVLPGIEELPLIESWAGFRPTSRDDAPIIGASGIEGLTYATGQHRNGILFTPLVGRIIHDYIVTGQLDDLAAPFTMERFAHA